MTLHELLIDCFVFACAGLSGRIAYRRQRRADNPRANQAATMSVVFITGAVIFALEALITFLRSGILA